MSYFGVILVLVSCVGHATWNLLSKGSRPSAGFFLAANLLVFLMGLPCLLLPGINLSLLGRDLWLVLLVTGIFQSVYFAALGLTYRHGDISFTYPVVRASPIFVVLVDGLVADRWPTMFPLLGIVLVIAGCFFLPWERLEVGPKGLAWRNYANKGAAWAVLAAFTSCGYTVMDHRGIGLMQSITPGFEGALAYSYLEWASTTLFLVVGVLISGGWRDVASAWTCQRLSVVAVGLLTFFTYLLVLLAYSHSEKVAYVAGLRQFSVVLGVIGGIVFFQERGGRFRLLAASVVTLGLILIAIGD